MMTSAEKSHLAPIRDTSADDEPLVARAGRGDMAATRMLYEAHYPYARRAALRIVRQPADADDVVQDAFVRAFGSLGELRRGSSFRPWLIAITVRLAYDLARRDGRARRRESPLSSAGLVAAGGEPASFDFHARLKQSIAALSDKLRIVLVMHAIEGYRHEEIAAALRIPVATSKTRLFEARRLLRRDLASFIDDGALHE